MTQELGVLSDGEIDPIVLWWVHNQQKLGLQQQIRLTKTLIQRWGYDHDQ